MGWQKTLPAVRAVWLVVAAQVIAAAVAADVGHTNEGPSVSDRAWSSIPGSTRALKQAQVVNPAGAALPTQTPDPRLPVAGNSQFVGSAETAISEDPVDIRIRTAFAPILDPIVDAIYRRPATAEPTAVAFGTGSPLRAFGDLVGSRIINAVSATLLGLPRNRLVIDAINANPLWTPVLGAVSAVGRVVGPVEDAALGLGTFVRTILTGGSVPDAVARAEAAGVNVQGLDQGLTPPTPLQQLPVSAIRNAVLPNVNGRKLQDLSSFLPSATPLPELKAIAKSSFAVSLDTLIADVPVDATLEKALSPVINPIVQYIISTPALATPLARLLGVNSQLESVLDNIGTPVLSLVTGFLKTNPVAAKAAQTFAAAPATQAFIKSISGIAIGIGPAEKAALAGATAVGNVAHGVQATGATAANAAQVVAGRRRLHDAVDAATTTAATAAAATNLPQLPGLPSNALTDALGYLHTHPQLRSALITFLKADSTKEFLATVTQLAIKINPKEFAALAGAVLVGEGAISAVLIHSVIDRVKAVLAPSPPPVPQQALPAPAVPALMPEVPATVPMPAATSVPATPVTPPGIISNTTVPAVSLPPPAVTAAPPPPVPAVPAPPVVPTPTPSPVMETPASTPAAATPTPNPVATPVSTPVVATPMPTPSATPVATPVSAQGLATPIPTPSPTPTPSPIEAAPVATFIPDLTTPPAMPVSTQLPPTSTPSPVASLPPPIVTPSPTPAATPAATPVPTLAPASPGAPVSPVAPFVAFGGKRHLLQGSVLAALFPSQTPNPKLPNPSNNPALAEYSILTSEDPFDQELTQALGPLLEPIATLLSRTPAVSNLLGGPFGVNSTLVERLTDAALPLIRGFRGNILQNPVLVDAIDFASQTPILQGFFNNVGNFSGDLAPVIRAYTRIGTYLGAVTSGQNASAALDAALNLFLGQTTSDQAALDQPLPEPVQASTDTPPAQPSPPPAQHSPAPHSPRVRREHEHNHSTPAPPHSPAGRHLLQSTTSGNAATLNIVDFLPRQTPNPQLPTVLNNPALGALRQVVADDPFAQRVVTALAPTLGPIVQYAARTPFFSNIITAIASSDDPVVKQITADITPVLNTFSQGILQNPTAASVLNGLTNGPEVSAFVNQVQSLAAMLSPNIQGLLNGASFLGNITSILQSQQAEVASLLQGPTPTSTPQPGLPLPNIGRRLQQAQEPQLPPLTQFLPAQTPNPDLPTPANNQALAALQQVVQNDPVNSRLEAVLAPALAPIFAYVARTPAFSNAITSVAGANSTLVQQLTEVATPLLNTFLQGILNNPVARQTLQDLTVTPNLERFLQGLQNLTQITQPPIVSLLNGASFLGNISSILQQQEQAISHALAASRNGPSRGLLQADTEDLLSLFGGQDAVSIGQSQATPVIAAANVPGQTPLPNVAAILPSQTPNPSLPTSSNNAALAALEGIIANDPFDQQLEAVLSPALGPLLSAISRTPAISNAIASALGSNNGVVEDITQAVTPLLKTFFVGILQNPFAYEALQNFTTSPTTQGLLSGLRNATELGLPGLQRLLGTANFLGNLTSIFQSEIDLFSPAQTPSPPLSDSQGHADSSGSTPYSQGVPDGRLGYGRHLLQSPVTAGQFLQQFFNPYYSASPPPASPHSSGPGSLLPSGLLPPGGASLGQLVQQLVASGAQPPVSDPVPAQPTGGAQSPAPVPVSQPPVLASLVPAPTPSPIPMPPPADPPAANPADPQQPYLTAADAPEVSAALATPQLPADPFARGPAAGLPELPGFGLPAAPGSGPGQSSFLPAGISALATAAVLADQVRPQVNDLAGLIAKEAGAALTDSPVGELLHSSAVSGLLPNLGAATPPPPATLNALLAAILPPGSPPAPPPSFLDLPAALGNAGSLVNATVTGLTANVRSAAQALGTDPITLLLNAAQDAPTPAPALTGISGALSGAGALVNQTVSRVRQNLQSAAAGLNLTVSQVAGVVGQALGQPAATPEPTPGPPSLSSLLASLGYGAASSDSPASPTGLGGILGSVLGGVAGQTPASSGGLGGMLASLGSAGNTLQQGLSELSNLESLIDPSAQAPSQDSGPSPSQAPASAPIAQPPSSLPVAGPPSQSPRDQQDPAELPTAGPALADIGSNVDATVAGLVGQINGAVASLNSTTADAVDSLTAAVERYNAAAAALEATSGLVNVTERVMDGLSAETDFALQTLQAMLSSTGNTVADIFQDMTSALQNATDAAGPGVLAGAQQLGRSVTGAIAGAAEALQGVRGAISDGAAAAGNATASAAAAGVTNTASGLQAAGSTLRSATAGALSGVGGAALGLNTTLVSFAQGLTGLAERVALSGPIAALGAPLNRTRQVAAVAGDLQGLLSAAAVQSLPSILQGGLLGVSDSPPSSMTAPNLTALDNALVELLSEDGGQLSLAPDQAPSSTLSMPPAQPMQAPVPTPAMPPSQPPLQAPLVAPSMPPSRPPTQAPEPTPAMTPAQPPFQAPMGALSMPPSQLPHQAPPPDPVRLLPQLPVQARVDSPSTPTPQVPAQLLPTVASGLGSATDRLQAVSEDVRGLNALLGSSVLGQLTPGDGDGAAGTGGLDLTSANNQLLQLLSAEGPEPTQDTASTARDPAPLNATDADSALVDLLSAEGPTPAQSPSSPRRSPEHAPRRSPAARSHAPEEAHAHASHARRTLQVSEPAQTAVDALAPAPLLSELALPFRLPQLPQLPHLALPPLPMPGQRPEAEQPSASAPRAGSLAELDLALPALAERGQADLSGLPKSKPSLPSLPIIGQVDAAQAPAQTAVAPQPEHGQAPDPFLLRPVLGFHLPNITLPSALQLGLPAQQMPSKQVDPSLSLTLGVSQAPTPSAQQEADLHAPRFVMPSVALPSLLSLPPLGALGSDPAVRQVASQAALAPADDPSLPAFQLPDVELPQLGLPLLAQPELPSLPFGQAPAESPALPALPALAALATAGLQMPQSVQTKAGAGAKAKPASGLPSNDALSVVAGAFAPVASAFEGGVDSTVSRLDDPVSLPQLELPLLTRPELPGLPFGRAPAESAALPLASLASFAAGDMQSPKMDSQKAQATVAAFPALEAASAPAISTQALVAGALGSLPQLRDPAWSLPQLGVPLLALPGAQPSASAPVPDLAAAMSPMTDSSQLSFIAPLPPGQAPDSQMGAPSQQRLPVPATAPAQQGIDALADLPRLALPQLPLFSGLAQVPTPLQSSQGPDLAQSPPQPAGLRTHVPSSSSQPGSLRTASAPDSSGQTLPELLARLDPFGNPTRAAAPHQALAPHSSSSVSMTELLADLDPFREPVRAPVVPVQAPAEASYPSAAAGSNAVFLPGLLADLDPFRERATASVPIQARAEASLYAPAPQSRDGISLSELLTDLDPFRLPVRASVPAQAPAQASVYPPAPASSSGGPIRQPARDLVPAQAPVEATQRLTPSPQSSSEILRDIFGLLDPLSNVSRAREPSRAPATAPAPARAQPAVPSPAQAPWQPAHSPQAHAPKEDARAPGPEQRRSHAPGSDPDQAHHRASPAHSPGHDEHPAQSPDHGRSPHPREAMSPAHDNRHPGEHSGAPRQAPHRSAAGDPDHAVREHSPGHESAAHGHTAKAPSPHHVENEHHTPRQAPHRSSDPSKRHHSPEHESAAHDHAADAPSPHHAEHERHAPRRASHRSPAGRKEAARAPPPPSGSLLRDAARAPLPGVPDVTTGVFLSSLLREAANTTGLTNATETLQQRAQAAGVPGNFTQTIKAAQNVTQEVQGIANTVDASVSVNLRGAPRPSPLQDFMKTFQGPVAGLANRTADDVAGFVDIILTQAMSMANSIPDIASPLEVIGQDLGFKVDTPLSVFVEKLKNLTVPTTVTEAEQEVKGLFSGFCTASSFDESDMEPSACVSEQVTLQLVPWSCAVDDSQKPATLTCTPAYLQLSTEPASCNLKYRSAPEWTSTECLLNTTVWGKSSQVTWGAKDDLPGLHRAVSNVAEGLADIGHNITSALPMPPMPSGMSMPPRPGQAMPPMPPMPPGLAMPPALSSSGPSGNMDAAGSQILGAWDLFSNFGQALSNFMSTTLHVSVGT